MSHQPTRFQWCVMMPRPASAAWRSPAGERVRSFAIITTTPNELCAELHNRMPVVLKPETWPEWLGEEPAPTSQAQGAARTVSLRRDDVLAGERPGRQRQEQRPELDRAHYCYGVGTLDQSP